MRTRRHISTAGYCIGVAAVAFLAIRGALDITAWIIQ